MRMNKIILSGNLCKDNELRFSNNNIAMLNNTIAVRNDFKNANGEYDSQFINISIFGKTAEYVSKYTIKGTKILLEGRLQNRTYDKQDGTKGYVTEVIVNSVELCGTKPKEEVAQVQPVQQEDPFTSFGEQLDLNNNFLE